MRAWVWRVELREVVIRIFGGVEGVGWSVEGKSVGYLAARAAGARERLVEVVERVGEVARGLGFDLTNFSWDGVGRGSGRVLSPSLSSELSSSPAEEPSSSMLSASSSSDTCSTPSAGTSSPRSWSSASFRLFKRSISYATPRPPSAGSSLISSKVRLVSIVAGTFRRSLSSRSAGSLDSAFFLENRSARFSALRAFFCFT